MTPSSIVMPPGTNSLEIPPELFPIIASFIPLRSAPHTLLSLALGNQRFYDIVRPLLYSRLILRNEDDAIMVIQKILGEQQLGLAVTELYVLSELSVETREGQKPFDVVSGLQTLVKRQMIPRLRALGIYLANGWDYDAERKTVSYGHLPAEFWRNLRHECPRLHILALRNVGHGYNQRWVSGPVIDGINRLSGLSILRLEWNNFALAAEDNCRMMKNLPHLTSSLHTLNLKNNFEDRDLTLVLSIDFPNLKWLCLQRFDSSNETSQIEDFFRRHPQLESLSLLHCLGKWFCNDIEVGFLPNLKHLKAKFEDIRILVSLLPQLVSLAFVESCNGQIPYLLRAVLPNGLPQLKSLEIHQTLVDWGHGELEGIFWHETLDGYFCTEKRRRKIPRKFMEKYMISIVRGAPNLEELGLHGMILSSAELKALGPTLAQFLKMERFYYRGISTDPAYNEISRQHVDEEQLSDFLSSAEALARVCTRLASVTSINSKHPLYVSAKVERDSAGEVTGVRRNDGLGLQISAHEDDPFPCKTSVEIRSAA